MKPRQLCKLSFLAAALWVAGAAHAQARNDDVAMLPIINSQNGRVEGVFMLQAADAAQQGARWRFGSRRLESAFGLSTGQSLALLCDGRGGIPTRMDRISNNCALGSIGPVSANASYGTRHQRVGVAIGRGQASVLPNWLAQGAAAGRAEQTDLALFAEYNIGRSGVVSIAGTTARARLMSPAEVPQMASHWNSLGLSVGGGVGNFSANVFGRVVEVPGQPGRWEGFGIGLSWRTPWSGQLSVGAENVVTRGKSPFAANGKEEEGTVPYVRYQQGL